MLRETGTYVLGQLVVVKSRHFDIGQNQVEPFSLELLQSLEYITSLLDLVAAHHQVKPKVLQADTVVLHYQDFFSH